MTKDTMLTELHELIAEGSLTTFLYDDIWAFLQTLHYYKIRHVYDNRDYFVQYVQGLDEQYQLLLEDRDDRVTSYEGIASGAMTAHHARSVIEGMFILSCMEFTCACPERMMIMQMENVKKKTIYSGQE